MCSPARSCWGWAGGWGGKISRGDVVGKRRLTPRTGDIFLQPRLLLRFKGGGVEPRAGEPGHAYSWVALRSLDILGGAVRGDWLLLCCCCCRAFPSGLVKKMREMAEEKGCGGAWTDEMHTSYLNWMESSFVSCMLSGGQFTHAAATPLPLDRCLPDGADSTADCRAGKCGTARTSARLRESRRGFPEGLSRIRKRLQRRHTAPRRQDDQVVPEFEPMKSGENARPLHASGVVQPAATDDQPLTMVQEKDDLPSFDR
ncbi:hypothetical protein Taro_031922 [Colocasia esculenta]|uniref:Uncharacterized protein n=1 Tax=Colocasia esculenta TaxID=4460 RepID=A0A843VVY2_COLES|nr:hypothetical protein [Colocasia esculenta]